MFASRGQERQAWEARVRALDVHPRNAAAEAARDADEGRGFAVAANEVRELAGRGASAVRNVSPHMSLDAKWLRGLRSCSVMRETNS